MSEDHLTPETSTRLEQVLWMHGQFRRRLEPLRVTPLQAGVLLFLHYAEGVVHGLIVSPDDRNSFAL